MKTSNIKVDLIDVDIAWAAGIVEGEACFDIRPSHCRTRDAENMAARVVVVMTDKDVVDRLCALFGGSVTRVTSPSLLANPHYKPAYRWLLSRREDLFNFLLRVRPYLLKRRGERCDEMLTFLERKVVHEG